VLIIWMPLMTRSRLDRFSRVHDVQELAHVDLGVPGDDPVRRVDPHCPLGVVDHIVDGNGAGAGADRIIIGIEVARWVHAPVGVDDQRPRQALPQIDVAVQRDPVGLGETRSRLDGVRVDGRDVLDPAHDGVGDPAHDGIERHGSHSTIFSTQLPIAPRSW